MRHNVTLPIRDDVVDAQGVRLLLLACFLRGYVSVRALPGGEA